MRRGDNIPPVSDYAHWNEDAYYMWYSENKYDMMYADEEIEDDYDDRYDDYDLDEDVDEEFTSEAEAREYYERMTPLCESISLGNPRDYQKIPKWRVTGITSKYWKEQNDRIKARRAAIRQAEYHEREARRLRGRN